MSHFKQTMDKIKQGFSYLEAGIDVEIEALVTTYKLLTSLEAAIGIEPMNKGFADLCLTTWLRRRAEKG